MNSLSPILSADEKIFESYKISQQPFIVVILDDWCPACQEFKPIVEYFAEKYFEAVPVFIIRSDEIFKFDFLKSLRKISTIPYSLFFIGENLCCEAPGAIRFNYFKTAIINLMNLHHSQ
jgi:thiol-disulfide isomerase/thioredoxin